MTEIERIGRGKRRHLYFSRELDAVLGDLVEEHIVVSNWVERLVWAGLVEEYGEEAVLEAIEQAQDEMGPEVRLRPEDRRSISLP
jgi:hypothetical protein